MAHKAVPRQQSVLLRQTEREISFCLVKLRRLVQSLAITERPFPTLSFLRLKRIVHARTCN